MTHPLTPREKVLLAICENKGRTSGDLADAIIATLASGSGDHAELARLADMADWMASGDPGTNGSVLLSASVATEHAADLKALLAEVAALRGERDTWRQLAENGAAGAVQHIDRATEAERKLAEAVGLLLGVDGGAATQDWWRVKVRTFLSKEAERG